MNYMDPDVRCPQKAVKLAHSLTLGGLNQILDKRIQS